MKCIGCLANKKRRLGVLLTRFIVFCVCIGYRRATIRHQREGRKVAPANLFEVHSYMGSLLKLIVWPSALYHLKEASDRHVLLVNKRSLGLSMAAAQLAT